MTNEHAIDVIKHLKKYYNDKNEWEDGYIGFDNEDNEAIDLAIKALKQQSCEDCISRQAVIDAINFEDEWLFDAKSHNADTKIAFSSLESRVKALPPVTPERPKGKWIIKDGKEQGYDIAGIKTWYIQIMCDKCGFIKTAIEGHTGQYKFCPNCGSDNGGDEDDE